MYSASFFIGNEMEGLLGEKVDVRIVKSMGYMQEALMVLLKEKSLNEIKIKEITDTAYVSRQTFYAHYDNKNTLFTSCVDIVFDRINKKIIKRINSTEQLSNRKKVEEIFEVFKENSEELEVLFTVDNKDLLIESMRMPTELVLKTLNMNGIMLELNVIQQKIFIDFMTGGFFMMLKAGLMDLEIMTSEEWANQMMFLFNMFIDEQEKE